VTFIFLAVDKGSLATFFSLSDIWGVATSITPNLWVLVACYLTQGTSSLFFPI
jgi:hypothetical protein